ncbi:MAG: non-ribosomal peptide synthetase, partial [Syntrophothermus sp.]
KENVVIVRNDKSGEKMLVAYYVPEKGKQINIQELKNFLKSKMPEYMVPSVFVEIERFPLTQTQKVDRKALPEPEAGALVSDVEYVEPSTQTEKKLARIWCNLLNLKKVGIHDDFFEIGGHSMIAVSLMVQIEKELGIRLPLATLFDRSTIHKLSELIDNKPENIKWRSLVPIRPEGSKKPLFLVHGMGLNVLLYTTVVNYLDPEQPVYGLQAKGLNGMDEPLETIEDIAAYYISEIMTIDKEGPYAMAGFSLGGRIAYEMARQLVAMGKAVSFLGVFDATADECFEGLPFPNKYFKKTQHFINYTSWNIASLFQEKEDKLALLSRKWHGLEKKIKGLDYTIPKEELVSQGRKSELPKYLRKVHKANHKADKKYIIRPYPGTVHLFKAQKQTFYLVNPETYGWDKVAMGGVFIHVIPGEHSNTFAPPNDKYFANVLQKSLNESTLIQ